MASKVKDRWICACKAEFFPPPMQQTRQASLKAALMEGESSRALWAEAAVGRLQKRPVLLVQTVAFLLPCYHPLIIGMVEEEHSINV